MTPPPTGPAGIYLIGVGVVLLVLIAAAIALAPSAT